MKRLISTTGLILLCAALITGCANRVSFIQKGKKVDEYRWKVEKLKYSRLSADQQALLSEKGKPDYIKFYRPMRKRGGGIFVRMFKFFGRGFINLFINTFRPMNSQRRIEAWVYEKEGTLVWFKEGKRVDYAAVE